MKQLISLIQNIVCSNITQLPHPYKLTYAATYRCNSRCTICNIWKRKSFHELTLPEIQTFFYKNPFFNWIDITGGEVFLKPNILEIIKIIIKSQNNLYLLHTQTNGILTSTILRNVQSILEMRPCKFILTLSVDGPPKLHNTLRGIKNNWSSTIATYKALEILRSPHFNCFFGMTLSGYNYRFIEDTYNALRSEIPRLTRHDLHFNIAHHSSHYYGNTETDLGNTPDISKELREFNAHKHIPFTGVQLLERMYQNLIPKYLKTKQTPIPCKALSGSLFLDPNGIIYPCSMWAVPLGNICDISYNLQPFWKSKLTAETRHVIDHKKCPNCWTPCEAYQSLLGRIVHL
jgi:MoaA/NifB/PqqE/SkfB family radical SAM enzyme